MNGSQSLGDLVKSKAKSETPTTDAQQPTKSPMQQIAEQLAEATNVVTLAEAFRSVKGPQPVAPPPAPPPPEQPIKIEAKLNLNEMMAAKEQSATFALQARDESSKQLWQEREKYFGEKIGNMERLMAEQRAGTKDPITSAREMFGFMREWEEYKSKQLKELGGAASAIPPSNIDAKTLLEMEKFKADTSVSLQKMQHEHDFKMEEMKQQREASTEENKRKWDIEIFKLNQQLKQQEAEQQRWALEFQEKKRGQAGAMDKITEIATSIAQAVVVQQSEEAGMGEEVQQVPEGKRNRITSSPVQEAPAHQTAGQQIIQDQSATEETEQSTVKVGTKKFKCQFQMGENLCGEWVTVTPGQTVAKCPKCETFYEVKE